MANITVSAIKWPNKMPPEKERDPETLYIVPQGIPERDQCLGRFMGVWSGLEQTLQILVYTLLGGSYATAGVVFSNCGGVAQICDLMNGLGELVLTTREQKELASLTKRLRKHNTKRNRLVHGAWTPDFKVDGDEQNRPIVSSTTWARVYSPTSPIEKQSIHDLNNKAVRSKYRFTTDDIDQVAKDVSKLREDITAYQLSIAHRLHPQGLKMR